MRGQGLGAVSRKYLPSNERDQGQASLLGQYPERQVVMPLRDRDRIVVDVE